MSFPGMPLSGMPGFPGMPQNGMTFPGTPQSGMTFPGMSPGYAPASFIPPSARTISEASTSPRRRTESRDAQSFFGAGGMPILLDHQLPTMAFADLREHAHLLYRTLGHARIGSLVPPNDHDLVEWIRFVQLSERQRRGSVTLQGGAMQAGAMHAGVMQAGAIVEARAQMMPGFIQEIRETPRQQQQNFILQQRATVNFMEKAVEVPQVIIEERFEEVPVTVVQERIVEVPTVHRIEVIRQVPNVTYQDAMKQVYLPIAEPMERVVEVPTVLNQEFIQEVPQLQTCDIYREVVNQSVQWLPKPVEKIVPQVVVCPVPVPVTATREVIVEVPRQETIEYVREVAVPELQQVEKKVARLEVQLQETIVEVPVIEIQDEIVEVPQTEVRELIKQIPRYDIQVIEKTVEMPVYEYVEKIVEVPHISYEERLIEVPEIEIREVVKQVPKVVMQYVDKQVPKPVFNYSERTIEVPSVLREDRLVEVNAPLFVETLHKVPRIQYQTVPREVPVAVFQPEERFIEVPVTLKAERPVEVPQVQLVDVVREVAKPFTEYVQKPVPRFETQAIEKIVEVPSTFVEERIVELPQVMIAEAVREEVAFFNQEVVKEIPRVAMHYVEKVTEVGQVSEDIIVQQPVFGTTTVPRFDMSTMQFGGAFRESCVPASLRVDRPAAQVGMTHSGSLGSLRRDSLNSQWKVGTRTQTSANLGRTDGGYFAAFNERRASRSNSAAQSMGSPASNLFRIGSMSELSQRESFRSAAQADGAVFQSRDLQARPTEGSRVTLSADIQYHGKELLKTGMQGTLLSIDSSGDALVDFDDLSVRRYVLASDVNKLQPALMVPVSGPSSVNFAMLETCVPANFAVNSARIPGMTEQRWQNGAAMRNGVRQTFPPSPAAGLRRASSTGALTRHG